ncbi:hypothetical protein ACH5RR_005439 [Cinchona calisaya]|uniref:MLO-like protein n=1 Tax=Cinchona calisaya TaxID=153742 RepID=A0ABD3ALF6_9GENT
MVAEAVPGSNLETTPTWAVATVCFVIISISIILEYSIHLVTNWLKKHRKKALCRAVDRLKSELMLLGFLSLLLAIIQEPISKICISEKLADTMLPCKKQNDSQSQLGRQTISLQVHQHIDVGVALSNMVVLPDGRRLLADDNDEDDDDINAVNNNNSSTNDPCSVKGKVPFVTQNGIQQLQIFIFVLAVMQIVYSVITMAFGRAKMRRWNGWEKETQTTEYHVENDPNRFRFAKQTTFGRRHITTCTQTSVLLWIKCFFRQFFNSVAKVDYFTLRHGFISAHLSVRYSNFNFRKYIERSLEEDFKVVVSISPLMWFIVVIFLLVDVHGWHAYLWMSYIPLLIVLVVGTKLEVIVAKMALQLKNQNTVIVGIPLVKPNDDLFWFSRPRFILFLLQATLFVNAFELAFFIWVTIEFGFDSCYHEHMVIIVTRLVLAVSVQVLCSYITLPLYALVTQMGSEFKSKVLDEQMPTIIKKWVAEVRIKRKKQDNSFETQSTSLSADCSLSLRNSPNQYSSQSQLPSHYHNGGEITEEEQQQQEEIMGEQQEDTYHLSSHPIH